MVSPKPAELRAIIGRFTAAGGLSLRSAQGDQGVHLFTRGTCYGQILPYCQTPVMSWSRAAHCAF